MMMKIGIYGGGFKPLTKGHFEVIQRASKENDIVHLFVSTGDRIRKNEHPIFWKNMKFIWEKFIEPILPQNVFVKYVPAPIKPIIESVYNLDPNSNIKLTVYADPNDMDNIFYPKRIEKFSELIKTDKLKLIKLNRGKDTSNVSGTMMRKFLHLGLKNEFINALPKPLKIHGDIIFSELNGFSD